MITKEQYTIEMQRYSNASSKAIPKKMLDKGWDYIRGWSPNRFKEVIDQGCLFYKEEYWR